PRIVARIDEILASEGDRVTEGQVLARLDDREERANVAQLEARVAFLRTELARLRRLGEEHITRQSYEQAESELRQAKAALDAAQHLLSEMTIRSPMDGVVLHQEGEVGEIVDKRQVLFWVGQIRPLRVSAEVDEEDIPPVREGQRTLIKADAFPGEILEGPGCRD
ncbi:MAG: efflux RND transporter periplasmic adaptor subunit, partial [Nitrospiraceae bacterium]